MLKFLIRLALTIDFYGILKLAERLEYGAGIFCFKLALRAGDEGYLDLAKFLKRQYSEEDAHARMLGSLVDGGNRIHRSHSNGIWSKSQGWQPLDGISQSYWAAKLFFWFRKPGELDWADILAFMCVIEEIVATFYEVLSESQDDSAFAIASKIFEQELGHAEYLQDRLRYFHSHPQRAIAHWQSRVPLAVLGAFIDIAPKLPEKIYRKLVESKQSNYVA